jgi:hypothetical protein
MVESSADGRYEPFTHGTQVVVGGLRQLER